MAEDDRLYTAIINNDLEYTEYIWRLSVQFQTLIIYKRKKVIRKIIILITFDYLLFMYLLKTA